MASEPVWFVRVNNEQRGPFTEEELRGQMNLGEIGNDVPAWREGLADWLPLGEAFGPFPAEPTPPEASRYASPIVRLFAFLIDCALSFVACVITAMPGQFAGARGARWTDSHMGMIMLLVGVAYFGILPSFLEGTPGLRALQCRLVRESGGRLSIAESLTRYGLSVFLNLFLGAGSLSMLIDKRRQALYDRFVKAVVIR
jgi:uncharacterized RDD family membrane protein YckC